MSQELRFTLREIIVTYYFQNSLSELQLDERSVTAQGIPGMAVKKLAFSTSHIKRMLYISFFCCQVLNVNSTFYFKMKLLFIHNFIF